MTLCKNDTKSSNLIFNLLRFCFMLSQNTCISEKLKDFKAQLDRSCTFLFTLKSAQNAKFAVNHILTWNNSRLLTDWEIVLTLNNFMGEKNSESISRFQVPRPN